MIEGLEEYTKTKTKKDWLQQQITISTNMIWGPTRRKEPEGNCSSRDLDMAKKMKFDEWNWISILIAAQNNAIGTKYEDH